MSTDGALPASNPDPTLALERTGAGLPSSYGPYKILEKLGAGGMGTVYLGRHQQTGALAAVKVLPGSLARETGFLERFHREIEAMQVLQHPRVVRFYESGSQNDIPWYAMEYVPGETVMALLRRERRVGWEQAIDWGLQICGALKAAHDAGIIHRDLKPSNLLVTPEGQIKLTDFGVAQVFAADRLTVTGGIIGTAEFMSPEQAEGKRANRQSDLYSLGAVLYCMVTGRPPFSGQSAVDIIQKHRYGQFDRPQSFVPEIPAALDELIVQLLAKNPDKRPPDAYVLSRRLAAIPRQKAYSEAAATRIQPADPEPVAGDSNLAVDSSLETRVEQGQAGGPGPSTLMRELVKLHFVREAQSHWLLDWFGSTTVLLILLVSLLSVGLWLNRRQAIAPETLFEKGVALMQASPGPGWSEARTAYFQPLLDRNDPEWSEKVLPYLRQIEVYEATRPKGLRGGRKPQPDSEPLRLIQQAQQLLEQSHPEQAEKLLVQIRVLLAADPEHQDLTALIDSLQEQCQSQREGIAAQRASWIETLLEQARQKIKQGQAQSARDLLRTLQSVYAGDDRLAEQQRAIQKLLDDLPPP